MILSDKLVNTVLPVFIFSCPLERRRSKSLSACCGFQNVKKALCALKDGQKLLKFIYEAELTMKLDDYKKNILWCADLYKVIQQNQGNDQTVVPTFCKHFKETMHLKPL